MTRSLRIEYANAHYHVMNRGQGQQFIFHSNQYYQTFLNTLTEACERFGCLVHAYCLMGNHYHLLLQTPHPNLAQVMKHVNGVYTQRYNRLKKTDGPLFRGRYKAIVVDADNYLLPLSRYIHRNPMDMKRPLVKKLEDYPWSSYPAYINHITAQNWLERETVYGLLGERQCYRGYQRYVDQPSHTEVEDFYSRSLNGVAIGGASFVECLQRHLKKHSNDAIPIESLLSKKITLEHIIKCTAKVYGADIGKITQVVKGPQKGFLARKVAMYLCQQVGGYPLQVIMKCFGLSNIGSVSFITSQIRQQLCQDVELKKTIARLKAYIVL